MLISRSLPCVVALEPRLLLAVGPDTLVFAHRGDQQTDTTVIYTVDPNGANLSTIPITVLHPKNPAFSPDRSKIVFTSQGDPLADETQEIFIINSDGTNETRLTENFRKLDSHPRFSPDGSRIVFVSTRDGNEEIYLMNADGSNQTRVTNNAASDTDPSFSPDGTRILFSTDRFGNYDVCTMDLVGQNVTRITNHYTPDRWPTFSPDGSRIAFQSTRDGFSDIWISDARGEFAGFPVTKLTNQTSMYVGAGSPAFSPDGTRVAYAEGSPGDQNVKIVDADDGANLIVAAPMPSGGLYGVAWASASTFAGLANGLLKVNGTTGSDTITLSTAAATTTVTLNAKSMSFKSADITSVQLYGGDGKDTIIAGTGAPAFYASGDAGDDKIIGGDFNDTLTAGAGRNTLFGGNGDDRLNGSSGRDFLYGDGGNDRLYGNAGNDYLIGGGNIDRIWGGIGDDFLAGNGQNDKLFGEDGNDQIYGNDGNDILYGQAGADILNGGAGSDNSDNDNADTRIAIDVVG